MSFRTRVSWLDGRVYSHIEKRGFSALKKFARFTRVSARSMIKKARQKKKSQLTKEQEAEYQKKLRLHKAGVLKNKPVRGWQSSNPGEPPRWRPNPRYGGKSPLRNLIIYHYDKESQSVFIGPEGYRTRQGNMGVGTLERGGERTYKTRKGVPVKVKAKPRPFMRPAMRKNLKILRELKG